MTRHITAHQAGHAAYWLGQCHENAIIGQALSGLNRSEYASTYLDGLRRSFGKAAAALGYDLVEKITLDEALALMPTPESNGINQGLNEDAFGNVVGR